MREDVIKEDYFEYLCDMICDKRHRKSDYISLFELLHSVPFEVIIEKDDGRETDGRYLRWHFCYGNEELEEYYSDAWKLERASVLEVLIGISERLEAQIGDSMVGNHINDRFWMLISNLDLEKFDEKSFDRKKIKEKIRFWMYRKYDKNGKGSIFPVTKSDKNLKNEEIWTQMCLWILENCM